MHRPWACQDWGETRLRLNADAGHERTYFALGARHVFEGVGYVECLDTKPILELYVERREWDGRWTRIYGTESYSCARWVGSVSSGQCLADVRFAYGWASDTGLRDVRLQAQAKLRGGSVTTVTTFGGSISEDGVVVLKLYRVEDEDR